MRAAKKYKRRYVTCTADGTQHRVQRVYTAWRGTYYADKASNYLTGCAACHAADKEYVDGLWREYYYSQGLLACYVN